MAVINFVKGEQYYTAEFQINGPVNVHIERAEAGALYFRQRSIDHGSYDLINGANWNNRGDLTIDTAIQGVVYPMWIKIESASEPTLAEMVEGEQSGGGAGTESGSNIKYLNVQKVHETGMFDTVVAMMPGLLAVKAVGSDFTSIVPLSYLNKSYYNEITSVAILDDFQGLIELENNINSSEVIANCINNAGCFEITKEQFYSLEA